MLSKLKHGTKDNSIVAFSRFCDKPRIEYCEEQNGTIIYIRAVQGHSHGGELNPTFFH